MQTLTGFQMFARSRHVQLKALSLHLGHFQFYMRHSFQPTHSDFLHTVFRSNQVISCVSFSASLFFANYTIWLQLYLIMSNIYVRFYFFCSKAGFLRSLRFLYTSIFVFHPAFAWDTLLPWRPWNNALSRKTHVAVHGATMPWHTLSKT